MQNEQINQILNKLDDLEKQIVKIKRGEFKRWFRTSELAEYLGLSESQIHSLKAKGIIECKKISGTNFFDKYEIDEIIESANTHEIGGVDV